MHDLSELKVQPTLKNIHPLSKIHEKKNVVHEKNEKNVIFLGFGFATSPPAAEVRQKAPD